MTSVDEPFRLNRILSEHLIKGATFDMSTNEGEKTSDAGTAIEFQSRTLVKQTGMALIFAWAALLSGIGFLIWNIVQVHDRILPYIKAVIDTQ